MGGVDFRAARHHEPPRAKRKCRVVLRNSRSRSSSHSENDAEYLMGLRKTGSSREYNSIDARFGTTLNAMALALKQQRLRSQSAVPEDDDIKALTQSLAGGMRIDKESVISPGPVLDTILESTEPAEDTYATDFILEEYLFSDGDTEVADDEQSIMGETASHLGNDDTERVGDTRQSTEKTSPTDGIRFVGYAAEKWKPEGYGSRPAGALPPMLQRQPSDFSDDSDVLPSLHDMGVLQFLPDQRPRDEPSPPLEPSSVHYFYSKDLEGIKRLKRAEEAGLRHEAVLPWPAANQFAHYPHKPVHYPPDDARRGLWRLADMAL